MNAQLWIATLLAAAWKATALLAAAWLASRALRRSPAADRHLVWTATLTAVLLLPAFSAWLPRWSVRVPAGLAPTITFQTTARAGSAPAGAVPAAAAWHAGPAQPAPRRLPVSFLLLGAWAAGAAVLAARYAAGALALRHWARRAQPAELPEFAACAAELPLRRPVRVLVSPRLGMPVASGWWRPVVLLPEAARSWPAERRRRVLLHELAHVRRHDCLSQACARLACAVYWFHPLAWLAWREFIKERERACDDLVLSAGTRPSDYAADLLELARTLPASAAAGVAMARPSQLEGRLLAILDGNRRRGAASAPVLALALGAAWALTAPLAALRPAQEPRAGADAVRFRATAGDVAGLDRLSEASLLDLDYPAAEQAALAALQVRETKFGPQSMEYAGGLLALAKVYRTWGRAKYAQSQPLLERAVSVIEAVKGPAAPELAEPLFHLGMYAQLHSDPAQASACYSRALPLAYGAGGTLAGRILTFQGILSESQGDPAQAEQLYQNALSALPGDSREAAAALDLYAALLRHLGRGPEADLMHNRGLAIRQAQFPVHPVDAPSGGVYRVGSGIRAPRLLVKAEPEYTQEARLAKVQGTSVLSVVIGADGVARDFQVKRFVGFGLDEKAIEAVQHWHFQPGQKDGQPVPVAATIEVNFRLM